jgi:membrane AbrB-like protein
MTGTALFLMVGAAGGYIGWRLGLPAGGLLGAMVATGVFGLLTGLSSSRPASFQLVAQLLVGTIIGMRISPDIFRILRSVAVPALVSIAALLLVGLAAGLFLSRVGRLDLLTALLASAPGGLADLGLVATTLQANAPVVVAIHTVRIVTVVTVITLLARMFAR